MRLPLILGLGAALASCSAEGGPGQPSPAESPPAATPAATTATTATTRLVLDVVP